MKYVRTNDGVYYVSSLRYQNPKKCECEHGFIIKQADTIEELCDEFVVVGSNRPKVCPTLGSANEMKKSLDNRYAINTIVYGEIWVDGELHKVAKMNEKGELELL